MPFAELTSARIHYETAGELDDPSLPVIVFCHSLGASLGIWDGQIARLAGRFRMVRYDLRGHGLSSSPQGPYSVDDMGRDGLELAGVLGIDTFNFCGLSIGGLIGQWLGLHAADRLQRLILANTGATIGEIDAWNTRIATVRKSGTGPIVPGTMERWFTADFRAQHPALIAAIEATLASTEPEGYAACCAVVRDADFRAVVQQISVPTMVISGSFDPSTPPTDGRYLAANIPHAEYLELPAAHISSVEAADQFSDALVRFLT